MEYQESKDLFGIDRYLSSKKGGLAINERATLIKYFSEKIERPAQFMGVRLAHYSMDQLYALKAQYEDRLKRNNIAAARKWWWYITRTTRIHADT